MAAAEITVMKWYDIDTVWPKIYGHLTSTRPCWTSSNTQLINIYTRDHLNPFRFFMLSVFSVPLTQCISSPDKTKEPTLPAPKPIQAGLHPSLSSSHHPVPTLLSAHGMYLGPGGTGPGALTPAMILQRNNEEERWLARQRKLRQEKEDRQYQVSEFRQQVLEQHLDIGRPGEAPELRNEGPRYRGSSFRAGLTLFSVV